MLRPAFLLLDEPAAGLSAEEIRRLGALLVEIAQDRHRRAAGRASCRPDLRHLPPRHRAQSRQDAGRRDAGRNPLAPGGGQCLSRRLSRCCASPALSTGYGKIGVLRGVDLTVGASEVVALLGPNGAGKTTLLRAVSGLLPWSGGVQFDGRDLARRRSARDRQGRPRACDRRASRVHAADACSTICCSRPTTCRAASAQRARRGGARLLSRDRRETPRARGRALRRPAADAGGGARPGAAPAAADAGRAVRRPLAGAGRSRVRAWCGGCARPGPRCCWSSS